MQRKILTKQLSVSGQIEPADLATLHAEGVRGIINNRPDGEVDGQPSSAQIEAEAERLGMDYRYVPVIPGQWTQATVNAFAAAMRELPAPLHAFCRSGMRSTSMWALQACAGGALVNTVMQQARQAGYDLAPLYTSLCQTGNTA
jgi:sulfide:quinone oxidoreductase